MFSALFLAIQISKSQFVVSMNNDQEYFNRTNNNNLPITIEPTEEITVDSETTTAESIFEHSNPIRRLDFNADTIDKIHSNIEIPESPSISTSKDTRPPESASIVRESSINELDNNKTNPATHPIVPLENGLIENIRKVFGNNKHAGSINKTEVKTHPKYSKVTGELISDEEHPCKRECKEGEEPMICYYHFDLEWYQTLSKACYDCPHVESDCSRQDCIPADGMSRPVNVINRMMPGPAIEVTLRFLL